MECLPLSDLRIFLLSIPLCEWLTSTPFLLLVYYLFFCWSFSVALVWCLGIKFNSTSDYYILSFTTFSTNIRGRAYQIWELNFILRTSWGQFKDLERLFISCESAERMWKEFTPFLKKIIPEENLGPNVLLLRDFQTKHPKRAVNLATYLMKMILTNCGQRDAHAFSTGNSCLCEIQSTKSNPN